MKHFNTETEAYNYVNHEAESREEVYGLNGSYIVCNPEEADELMKAGVNLTIASPEEEGGDLGVEDDIDPDWCNEDMDGDHESALESVYGSSENFDIDHDDGGFFEE